MRINLIVLALLALPACKGPDLRPTCREARITFEHLRGDYVKQLPAPLAKARLAEIDAAILNLKTAEETP
jgi:hypothetical protein